MSKNQWPVCKHCGEINKDVFDSFSDFKDGDGYFIECPECERLTKFLYREKPLGKEEIIEFEPIEETKE